MRIETVSSVTHRFEDGAELEMSGVRVRHGRLLFCLLESGDRVAWEVYDGLLDAVVAQGEEERPPM